MNKRVFLVHGWGGSPQYGWFPWLKHQLELKSFDVFVPQLPDTDSPRIGPWVSTLALTVGTVDSQTFFVGHSMGCQTIARYLQTLPEGTTVGGGVFVAGFFKRLTNCDIEPGEKETADHWMNAPIDLQKIATHLPKSTALFSDDDPHVPLENQDAFRDILHSKIITEKQKGHYAQDDGVMELPIVLDEFLRMK